MTTREEAERAKARERMAASDYGRGPTSEKFTEVGRGETREIVGRAVGMSGPTYQAAKMAVLAAEADPETFGPLAEATDRTGKVRDPADRAAGKAGRPPASGLYADRRAFVEDLLAAAGRLRGYQRPSVALLARQMLLGVSTFHKYCARYQVSWRDAIRAARLRERRVS